MTTEVLMRSTNVTRVEYKVDRTRRAERNGHAGGVLWFIRSRPVDANEPTAP